MNIEEIEERVTNTVDNLFVELALELKLKSGDIDPMQLHELRHVHYKGIAVIIENWIKNNKE